MLKKYLLSLILLFGGVSLSLNAQSDSFFKSTDSYQNREANVSINSGLTLDPMNPQSTDSEAPLGTGLLIMVAAGAGYTAVRRKGSFRKGITMLLACTLIFGMTQCKKKDVVTVVDHNENLVPMTLTVNGAKTSFDSGVISWVNGDKVNVVAGGKCIGTLVYSSADNNFVGSVDLDDFSDNVDATFYFYYVGNNEVTIGSTSFVMSMSGQDGDKAKLGNFHVSKGMQAVIIDKSGMTVSANMRSYTALAYFAVNGFNRYNESGENLYMYGDNIYEQLTINFSDNTITPDHAGYYISAGTSANQTAAYYMFIPTSADGQSHVHHVVNFVNKRTAATVDFQYGIVSNGWYCNGSYNQPIAVTGAEYYQGTLRGVFTINDSKGTAHFSQGNLQFTRESTSYAWSTGVWSFMTNQYDKTNTNSIGNDYANVIAVSHFGWGTSGYDNGQTSYLPYNTNNTSSNYLNTESLTGSADWGYNQISNGGNTLAQWRTLTDLEWVYLLSGRDNAANKCRQSTVCEQTGLIILPDSFIDPNKNNGNSAFDYTAVNYTTNVYNTDNWPFMEAAGAVFLPASGIRNNISFNNIGTYGDYWSSTRSTATSYGYAMFFTSNSITPKTGNYGAMKYNGYCVRLVR